MQLYLRRSLPPQIHVPHPVVTTLHVAALVHTVCIRCYVWNPMSYSKSWVCLTRNIFKWQSVHNRVHITHLSRQTSSHLIFITKCYLEINSNCAMLRNSNKCSASDYEYHQPWLHSLGAAGHECMGVQGSEVTIGGKVQGYVFARSDNRNCNWLWLYFSR